MTHISYLTNKLMINLVKYAKINVTICNLIYNVSNVVKNDRNNLAGRH